jgi:Ca2+-binding RTX toxin-like protein
LTQHIEDDFTATIDTLGILTVSQPATGTIQYVGDYDWFKVTLEAGKTYQFNLTGTTLSDPSMQLMNGIGRQLAENDDIKVDTNLNSQIVFTVIDSGTYFIEASAFENTSGNYSLSMQEIVDKTAPTVSQFSPSKNANAVSIDANIVLTFNELIKSATGTITLYDTSGLVVESFDVATSNAISVTGVTLTINPTQDLQNSHDYLLAFDAGSVTDLTGNAYNPTGNYNFATKAIPISGTNKADKMLGTNYADTLYGLAGNDRLNGGLADDYLDGGKGADTLIGGSGNDTYVIDNAGDKIVETGLIDTSDTVISSISYSLGSKLENLTLIGNAKLNGNGNSLANRLIGNANNNSLNGKAGADDIYGGLGNDKLTGGTGDDLFIFDSTLAKNNVDTITDFVRGQDLLTLDNTIFSQFNGQASDFIAVPKLSTGSFHGEHMIFDKTAHTLYYDADGAGTGAEAQAFVKLVGISNLDANDLIFN